MNNNNLIKDINIQDLQEYINYFIKYYGYIENSTYEDKADNIHQIYGFACKYISDTYTKKEIEELDNINKYEIVVTDVMIAIDELLENEKLYNKFIVEFSSSNKTIIAEFYTSKNYNSIDELVDRWHININDRKRAYTNYHYIR